ncbi:LysR family transcriptional regulator [Ramlibacter sp.]|uniref:LysR family transcriptional regulator n=1 Tax=Ramlibacter sp. TaxID=1917967 RepID=UPI001834BB09|nr:LysR family transcriptional regulator [Ramlibacter sp.]MBA2673091.1 LysR family transcriptional regulator [Ramlibacter sp.]
MNPTHFALLHAFAQVARHHSFSRAAQAAGVTPTALSKSVRRLEAQLGVRLLNRTTRAVQLTAEGALLLEQVAPALSAIDGAVAALASGDKEVRGELRLTVPTVAYSMLIEPHLGAFMRRYPQLRLEVSVDDGLRDIVADGFDAGVRLGERLALDMVATPLLRSERMAVVAAPAYLQGRPPVASPADLLAHDCIRLRLKTTRALYPWTLAVDGHPLEMEVKGRLVVDSMPAVVAAAIAGCGVACTFERLATGAIAEGRLVRLLPTHGAEVPGWFVYFPSRLHMAARMRAFIDFFRAANER